MLSVQGSCSEGSRNEVAMDAHRNGNAVAPEPPTFICTVNGHNTLHSWRSVLLGRGRGGGGAK